MPEKHSKDTEAPIEREESLSVTHEDWEEFLNAMHGYVTAAFLPSWNLPESLSDLPSRAVETFLRRREFALGYPDDLNAITPDAVRKRLFYHLYRKYHNQRKQSALKKNNHKRDTDQKSTERQTDNQNFCDSLTSCLTSESPVEALLRILDDDGIRLNEECKHIAKLCAEEYDITEIAVQMDLTNHQVRRRIVQIREIFNQHGYMREKKND